MIKFYWGKKVCNNFWMIYAPRVVALFFIFFNVIGMYLYPGGTIHNPDSANYQLAHNFFSDLGRAVAHNGLQNFHASFIFNLTLLLIGTTFCIFYFAMSSLFKDTKLNLILSNLGAIFGLLAGLSFIGVALTPSDLNLGLHVFFANSIFRMALATSLCFGVVIIRTSVIPSKYAVGYFLFSVALIIYIGVGEYGPSARESEIAMVFQVVAQKVIVLIFLLSVVYQTFGFSNNPILLKKNRYF
tara:strand:- start:139 stop:864 length:726 start_codon:yes stop_codon:yes gene_type:complete